MNSKSGRRAPTMNDVARLAEVSQTTVSFVINDAPNASISTETRDKVWAAVEKLSYRPNALAQGLRMQRSNLIGFITDEIATTPHAGRIFEGAQDVAWQAEKILLLVNTKNNPAMEQSAVDVLLERQVEGIIYATMYHRPVQPPSGLYEVPAVLLDCFDENRSFSSVVPDEVAGGREAVTYLVSKGHRRIGFLNNVDSIPATFGRLKGYQQALEAGGLLFDPQLVRQECTDAEGGYRCAQQLMQLPDRPTALFCFNDRMAMGAYDALRKLGLRIPEDVNIVGFDNQELIAAHLYPGLTTMELPHYDMGVWAIEHLLQQIRSENESLPIQKKLPCRLIERGSC